jgi:hypothetical protein
MRKKLLSLQMDEEPFLQLSQFVLAGIAAP